MKRAFTLIEIMFSAVIMASLLVGLLSVFIYCFDIQETSRKTSYVSQQVRAKVEEAKRVNFTDIIAVYNGVNVDLAPAVNGKIYITANYVVGSNNDLIALRVVGGWSQRGGRIIGEGTLVGVNKVFTFSDINGNQKYDSPLVIETVIANKSG